MTALPKTFGVKIRKFGIFLVLLVALHFPWTKTELKIVEYDQDKVQEYDQDKTEMKIVEYDKIQCRSSDSLMGMAQIESLPC